VDPLGEIENPGLREETIGHGVLVPDKALDEVDDELPVVVGLLPVALAGLKHVDNEQLAGERCTFCKVTANKLGAMVQD